MNRSSQWDATRPGIVFAFLNPDMNPDTQVLYLYSLRRSVHSSLVSHSSDREDGCFADFAADVADDSSHIKTGT
jgi:hypothetical protein